MSFERAIEESMQKLLVFLFAGAVTVLTGCNAPPAPGPDRQFEGALGGAVAGAGTGAVTGFQVGAGTGPGAFVGAGVGAVAGSIQGFMVDQTDESLVAMKREVHQERERQYAHEVLAEHYKRRMELYPTRDIYPADLFFRGDQAKLRPEAQSLLMEIAKMNKERLSWSTLIVAAYVKAADSKSPFAHWLADQRSRTIGDALVRGGVEPRRIKTRAIVMAGPLVIDPHDRQDRFNQAIEFIPEDR